MTNVALKKTTAKVPRMRAINDTIFGDDFRAYLKTGTRERDCINLMKDLSLRSFLKSKKNRKTLTKVMGEYLLRRNTAGQYDYSDSKHISFTEVAKRNVDVLRVLTNPGIRRMTKLVKGGLIIRSTYTVDSTDTKLINRVEVQSKHRFIFNEEHSCSALL